MNLDKVFTTTRVVVSEEIDNLNHVNNVVYVQWVQDIATLHWEYLVKDINAEDLIWVLVKHEIDYIGQAVLNDEVTLKTWVGETKGVKSVRHVEIFKGDKLLAKSQTTWCLLNSKTLRPTRITEDIFNLLSPS
ncbi:thioesterase family protein [uncultured Tenacibaculum sp.]|uniref:acyl-CoA thioesterase n=1 Tax=uncultured Tenacibaculum sp. TaxID=174713 RepID=UPI0026249817|nr:thioesterase family protein [uncultured Tenacibaculum sp.]